MSQLLAGFFAEAGHEVKVTTESVGKASDSFGYQVVRQPSCRRLIGLVRWCDVYFHNNISLGSGWPLLVIPRPWVIAHQTWICSVGGVLGWRERMKRYVLRYARNVAVSESVARMLPVAASVIGNPYQDELFHVMPGTARDRDLVFVGRLVSDKGVDVLLDALKSLRDGASLRPMVTIVGDGPEREAISQQIRAYGLDDQVVLAGVQQGSDLVKLLNEHKILVVPSRWKEPFGVVALEGIACGCVVVGSADGGLSEAIGPCGVTFPNGDSAELAAALVPLLTSPGEIERYRSGAENHLRQHSVGSIAASYLEVFRDVVENREHRRLGYVRRVSAS